MKLLTRNYIDLVCVIFWIAMAIRDGKPLFWYEMGIAALILANTLTDMLVQARIRQLEELLEQARKALRSV